MHRWLAFSIVLLLLAGLVRGAEKDVPAAQLSGVRREPVAAVFWTDDRALIACAKSGTLIVWDSAKQRIEQEFAVGKQLRGVVRLSDRELVAIDDKTHELIQLRYDGERLTELARHSVSAHPASLCEFKEAGQQFVAVASLWSRQVTVWSREQTASAKGDGLWQLQTTTDLAFEPRLILPVGYQVTDRNGRVVPGADPQITLIVSEAFGSRLALINPHRGNKQELNTYSHNFGGLTYSLDRSSIFFTHQNLEQRTPITVERLTRGLVMSNSFTEWETGGQRIPIRRFGPEKMTQTKIAHTAPGDPAGIALIGSQMLVCLAGTDEVWLTSPAGEMGLRIAAGKRPRFITTRGQRAICLGELDDSITLMDIKGADSTGVTSLLDRRSAERELSPAERGERLFFSAKNSAGQQMSCHSCHTDGHTNGLLADTLGDNTHGTPKRVLTLRGTRLTDLWAWNGEMKTLQDNVHKSLQETMHAPQIEPADVDDLVSFLHTLPPVLPLKPTVNDEADRLLVEKGKQIFHREACDVCHVPPLTYTSHASYDVGLVDEKGLKKFNPPSLRGVGRLRKLLHDNRASSLRDVFETQGHQLKEPLPEEELRALVRFLESL